MRRAAKVDGNQGQIVEGLRSVGASVEPLHQVGKGVPDLLVGYRGQNHLLEVKDGSKRPSEQRLTPDQVKWHARWSGRVVVVRSLGEALEAIGVKLAAADTGTCICRCHEAPF